MLAAASGTLHLLVIRYLRTSNCIKVGHLKSTTCMIFVKTSQLFCWDYPVHSHPRDLQNKFLTTRSIKTRSGRLGLIQSSCTVSMMHLSCKHGRRIKKLVWYVTYTCICLFLLLVSYLFVVGMTKLVEGMKPLDCTASDRCFGSAARLWLFAIV